MANDRIESKDILDPKLIQDLSEVNKELAKSIQLMTSLTKESIDFFKSFRPEVIQDVTNSQRAYNEAVIKSEAVNKQAVTTAEKLRQKKESLTKEDIRSKMEIQNRRKAIQESIKAEKAQAGSINDLTRKNKILSERIKNVSTETDIGRKRIANMNKMLDANNAKINANSDAFTKQKRNIGNYSSALGNARKSLINFAAGFIGLRAAFRVIGDAIKTIATFEQAMSKVKAVTGASTKDFGLLTDNAKKLGSSTSKTSTEVAGLQLEFSKLGFSTKEILAATEATIQLSIAAGSDLADSAVIAASTVRGFGLDASDTQKVVDVMAKSFASSALDLEKFKTGMGIAAPVAKSFGKDIEFTTAQLSVLSDSGIDASTAGTSLRNMFLELSKKGMTWEEGLAKINNSTNKNVTALDLFGKRGATAALILAENTDKSDKLEKSYRNSAGAAKEMADIMEDNLIGDTKKLSSAWEGFILGLNSGDGVITKVFRTLTQGLTGAISKIQKLNMTANEIGLSQAEKSFKATQTYIVNENKKIQDARLKEEKSNAEMMIKLTNDELTALKNRFYYSKKSLKELETALIYHTKSLELLNEFEEDLSNQSNERIEDRINREEEVTISTNEELEKRLEVSQEIAKQELELQKIIIQGKIDSEEKGTDEQFRLRRELFEKTKELELLAAGENQILQQSALERYKNHLAKLALEQEDYSIKKLESTFEQYESENELLEENLQTIQDIEIEKLQEKYEKEKEILDQQVIDQQAADEAKKQSRQYYTDFAIGAAGQLSNSIFGYLDAQLNAQLNADIRAAKSRGASVAEIEAIELAAAKKKKQRALTEAIINTALGVTSALTGTYPLSIIMAVLAAALGAVEIATIASESFAKGTKDSGSKGIIAEVGEAGTERINYPDGTSALTPNSSTYTYLPPHSEVVPNRILQQELTQMQSIGCARSSNEDENRRRQEHKEMMRALRNRDETVINITEGGFGVIARKGINKTSYIDNKYRS